MSAKKTEIDYQGTEIKFRWGKWRLEYVWLKLSFETLKQAKAFLDRQAPIDFVPNAVYKINQGKKWEGIFKSRSFTGNREWIYTFINTEDGIAYFTTHGKGITKKRKQRK